MLGMAVAMTLRTASSVLAVGSKKKPPSKVLTAPEDLGRPVKVASAERDVQVLRHGPGIPDHAQHARRGRRDANCSALARITAAESSARAAAGDVKAREELVKGSRRSRNGRVHRGGLDDNLREWRLDADGAAADHERMLANTLTFPGRRRPWTRLALVSSGACIWMIGRGGSWQL